MWWIMRWEISDCYGWIKNDVEMQSFDHGGEGGRNEARYALASLEVSRSFCMNCYVRVVATLWTIQVTARMQLSDCGLIIGRIHTWKVWSWIVECSRTIKNSLVATHYSRPSSSTRSIRQYSIFLTLNVSFPSASSSLALNTLSRVEFQAKNP